MSWLTRLHPPSRDRGVWHDLVDDGSDARLAAVAEQCQAEAAAAADTTDAVVELSSGLTVPVWLARDDDA